MSSRAGLRTLFAAVVRGLPARRSLTVGAALLTAVAIASAVLGPVYQAAASQSFLVTRLKETSPVSSGTSITWFPSGALAGDVTRALSEAPDVGAAVLGAEFLPATLTLESTRVEFRKVFARNFNGEVHLTAKSGACAHLIVTGACPAGPGQAILLKADAEFIGIGVGDHVPYPGTRTGLDIVGTYSAPADASRFWYDDSRLATVPPAPDPHSGLTPYQ